MALTYEPLATTNLNGANTASFNSFSGYTDLILIVQGTVTTGNSFYIQFNGDTGANYSISNMQGNGSTIAGGRDTNATYINVYGGMGTSIPTMYKVQIFSYSTSNATKSLLSEGSIDTSSGGLVNRVVGTWRNSSAITSFSMTTFAGTFGSGSVASLYGIKAA